MPPRILVRRLQNSVFDHLTTYNVAPRPFPLCLRQAPRRYKTGEEKPLPEASKPGPGPNQEQLPHVSEEAAATSKAQGEKGPDLEQGTPVEEVLKRDPSGAEKAPKVLQSKATAASSMPTTRSYSTSTRRMQELQLHPDANAQLSTASEKVPRTGHIFELPTLPLPEHSHLKSKYRYDEVVHQITRLIMRDGKLAKAERDMAAILNHLRTAPAPRYNPQRPVVPDAPPATHLPLNPALYLTIAIDSVAPLLRLRSQRGAAGGGVALPLPIPLTARQRRRRAMMWILEAVDKKPSRGSGKLMFAKRVAEEFVAVIEGRSSVWEKRISVHKMGVSARSNLPRSRRR